MSVINICPECKVPEIFTTEHLWLNNGEIVARSAQRDRLAFMECENFDPLFQNIGEIIGIPIERMVIDITARMVEAYVGHLVPEDVKSLLLSMKPGDAVQGERCRQLIDALNEANIILAGIMGLGKYESKHYRYQREEGDYSTAWVTEPYSVPFAVGTHAGFDSALAGRECAVDYKRISPITYELTAYWATSDEELKERLKLKQYTHKEGDIELERCGTCGGPAALAGLRWYPDRGVIESTFTGRRMAMLGPSMLDPVFEELEDELGKTIPRAVVEAQRRFVKTGFYSIEEVSDEGDFRDHLALRGLGNLKKVEMGEKGVRVRVDNVILHLMVVGLIQGIFEMAFDVNSHVEWELSEDGDLELEVTPAG